jgi:hypothetical protein
VPSVGGGGGGLTRSADGGLDEVAEFFRAAARFSCRCVTSARSYVRWQHGEQDLRARLAMRFYDRNRQLQWHYQRERLHGKQSFQEELWEWLRRYEIAWDERYVWD